MLRILRRHGGQEGAEAVLATMCASGQERPQILLVPEQASHQMERQLCAVGGNGVSLYGEVLSFSRLANRVFSVAGGLTEETLDAGGRLLLLYNALQAVAPQLKVYGSPSRKPEFLTAMLSTVDELKSCCISPEILAEIGQEEDSGQGEKYQDLALICGMYDALTARSGLDPKDRLTRLAQRLNACDYGSGVDFYLYGFTDFTPQEMQVIGALLPRANSVTVALTYKEESAHDVFATPQRTQLQLKGLAQDCHVPVVVEELSAPEGAVAPGLAFLEEHLFGETAVYDAPCPEITVFTAHSPRSEVEWTAATIRELARVGGYRFRDIGVAARSYESYGQLVEQIFPQYHIPVFSATMTDVLQRPILALVTAALDTVTMGYRYEDVFRYLKTFLTDLTMDEVDVLENYVLKWSIRGNQWTQKKDWTMHPRGHGLSFEERDRATLEQVNSARRKVIAPLEGLRTNKNATGRGQAVAVYQLLEDIHLSQRLEERTATLQAQGELNLAGEYGQFWGILCNGLEQCAALLDETPMGLDQFSRLFQLVLSQYDVGTIPVSLDRVTAGDMPRIVNQPLKVLFVLGGDSGAIPQVTTAPGLLNDEDREVLIHYGLEPAPQATPRLHRELNMVYESATMPTEGLYVTWPRTGGGGEVCRPSFLVSRLEELFPQRCAVDESDLNGTFRLVAPGVALTQGWRAPGVLRVLGEVEEYRDQVARIAQGKVWNRGALSMDGVRALYGKYVPMSASRMDRYQSCHFAYFMQYGLKAEPRSVAGFHAPEYGTFVHYVLEHAFRNTKTPTPEQVSAIVERYAQEELGGLDGQTPRFRYLFRRLLKTVQRVVTNVSDELTASAFAPISFELGFGRSGDLPGIEVQEGDMTISISGLVDRVDGWVKDGKLYLRVVDYKTGRKSFDLTEIWHGMGLQMLLYLFALEREGHQLYGREIVPAGVLYLPAREVILQGGRQMSEGACQVEMDKQLRRHGLVLNQPEVVRAMEDVDTTGGRFLPIRVTSKGDITGESLVSAQQLGRLKVHIDHILQDICKEMAAGNITADPYWRGPEQNACQYCQFAAACQFEDGRGSDRRRHLVKVDDFWSAVTPEEKRGE